jgi:hypothetical protein
MTKQAEKILKTPSVRIFALVATLLAGVAFESCRKPDEEFLTYEAILINFMENNIDARELFDDRIYPADSLLILEEDGIHRSLLVESRAHQGYSADFRSDQLPPVNTFFGLTYWAEVSTSSTYQGGFNQTPALDGGPLDTSWNYTLARGALFYKLDGDAAALKGWEFVGLDVGKALSTVEPDIMIWRNPGTLDAKRLSNHGQPSELLTIELGKFSRYTYRSEIPVVSSGDSIDITSETVQTVSAHTSTGFRELERTKLPGGPYHYGFRTPQATPGGRFYHFISFQEGPSVTIDSNQFQVEIIEVVDSLPDSVLYERIRWLFFERQDSIFDLIADSFICVDSLPTPPYTCIDSLNIRDSIFSHIDTFQDSSLKIDTVINYTDTQFIHDTVSLPPVIDNFVTGQAWVYPYGVR